MIYNYANALLNKMASAVFSTAFLLLLFSAPPLIAENSPNNGAYYDVKQDNIYYELKKADSYTRYDRYVVVDADYTDRLVIADYIEGLPVDYVYNMNGRTDIEYVSIGSQVRNADFRFCTYLSEVDLSRMEMVNARIDVSNTDVRRLEIPAIYVTAYYCENLEEVIYTGIGSGSFTSCTKLSTATLHEDMTVCPLFNLCRELQSIHIPAGVKTIPNNAFRDCSSLSSVTFADGSQLTTIYDYAFCGTAIRHFDCPDGVEKICTRAFAGTPIEEFRLPASIKANSEVPGNIFFDCHALAKIDYPNLQTLLALSPKFAEQDSHYNKFEKCVELLVGGELLTDLVIPTSAPNTDFTRTTGLRSVTIDNATSRKSHGFALIPSLEELSVGAGEIEIYCKGCTNLRTVDVSPKHKSTRLYYITNAFSGCTSLESISFPNVEELSYDCFRECTSLRMVDFPKVRTIEQSCFEGCSSLTEVNLPVVENLGWRSFKGCSALETIVLPEVTEFGNYSSGSIFEGCSSLANVECPKVKVVGPGSFKWCTNLAHFSFEQLTAIKEEAFMGTGFTEVSIPLTCEVGINAFSSCHKLKQLSMPVTGRGVVNDLPVAEKLVFYANPDASLTVGNCFIENEGNIRVNGSIDELELGYIPGLNRLSVMGRVNDFLLEINIVPKEFEVRTIEEYLSWKFRNNAFTPGFQADGPDLIDLYVSGQLVKDLLIPPGSNVPNYAFNKFNIESVTIGGFKTDAPTTINLRSFYKCTNLKELNAYGNLMAIGDDAFMHTGLEKVDLPSTLLGMGAYCFAYCDNLRHISFPQSLTAFPIGAVFGCDKLESLIIPEGVTYCGHQIASGTKNKGLKTISLPSTIEALSRAYFPSFEDFTHELEFLSWAYVAPSANFDNFTGFTVHVPLGAGQNYKNKAAWTNAVIVEDLLVGNNVKVEGTDVVVYVPKQTGVSERAAVTKYTVLCYDASDDDRSEPDYTFEFGADGQELPTKSRSATDVQWQELHLTGLPSNTTYVIDIKGHTATNDVIYSHSQEVITGMVGVETNLINNDIILKTSTLYVPEKYAGEILDIYSVGGSQVLSTRISELGSEIVLDLECGVYVLRCGDTTLKFKL